MEKVNSFAVFEDKLNKALAKFEKLDGMSSDRMAAEFWEIQSQFEKMTPEQYESNESQILLERQKLLNEKHQEITGNLVA